MKDAMEDAIEVFVVLVAATSLFFLGRVSVDDNPCSSVHPSADVEATPEGWDYIGGDPGVWQDTDGKVVGYSLHEDSIIYKSAECAMTWQVYDN